MRHPSKQGGFLARYVRKGTSYERAKDVVQEKNRANEERRAHSAHTGRP